MAAWTLAEAQAQLDVWMAANLALANGKSYSIGDKAVTRSECLEQIKFWRAEVNRLTATGGQGGIRMRRGIL